MDLQVHGSGTQDSWVQLAICIGQSDRDVTAVRLQTDQGTFWIASAYLGHDQLGPLPGEKLRRLVADAERQKICLIIGCDANAHHTVWGSTDINDRVSNTGNEPTFVTRNRQEVLDITLVSDSIHQRILNWKVSEEHSFPDQRYIQFSLNDVTTKQLAFRNYRKTNWKKYRETLKSLLKPEFLSYPSNTIDLDNKVNDLTSALNLSMNNSCPLIQLKHHKQSRPISARHKFKKQSRSDYKREAKVGHQRLQTIQIRWTGWYNTSRTSNGIRYSNSHLRDNSEWMCKLETHPCPMERS
ncbi:uncharacterized protein LOC129919170 [Episyrphus balteatus]|uniref:uncharacterized protein LOC129919170 n=1 Tax=Episyrphus balteatus TaxID=286459 RepID=UPI002484DE38|nr:uncharacterized protein LOC129919170 [Episyrphus balteatus]